MVSAFALKVRWDGEVPKWGLVPDTGGFISQSQKQRKKKTWK